MGRGGDHLPFLDKGYPAIRFSVAVENYDHQHQDLRTENGVVYGDTIDAMDFAYLAKVTALNVRALDRLARAPLPPAADRRGRGADLHHGQVDRGARRGDLLDLAAPHRRGGLGRDAGDRAGRRHQRQARRRARRRLDFRRQRLLGRGRVQPGRERGAGGRIRAAAEARG